MGFGAFLAIFARCFLSCLFLFSSFPKLKRPRAFASVIRNYALVPDSAVSIISRTLPLLEIILAISLLANVLTPYAGAGTLCLLAVYTGAVTFNLVRGHNDHFCGCGFGRGQKLSWVVVARNFGLIALAVVVMVGPRVVLVPHAGSLANSTIAVSVSRYILVLLVSLVTLAILMLVQSLSVLQSTLKIPQRAQAGRASGIR